MSEQSDYERGHKAGGIAERLDSHDRHFEAINGSLAEVAKELASLNMGVQRLADQAESDARTRIATATALREADEARRTSDESRWTPLARAMIVLGALVTVGSLILSVYLATAR